MTSNNISCINKKCYGCGTCQHICPVGAIEMKENSEGFLYPFIDETKCVNCGLCLNKCPVNEIKYPTFTKEYYGFSSTGEYKKQSASGGFATFLSLKVLEKNGVVCGCALVDNVAKHIIVEDKKDLYKLQSSKYVQSDVNDVYVRIKNYLDNNKLVLFIATPCQVAGLHNYLSKKYDNLITVDLVCHGVPSPKLFRNYVDYLSQKEKSEINDYNFRYKGNKGWGIYYQYYKCKATGEVRSDPLMCNRYGSDFLRGDNYRESCYTCQFASLETRVGDFTIGDFWGVEKARPEKYDKLGVSCVCINTDKGKSFIKDCLNEESFFKISKEDILLRQHNLVGPTKRNSARDTYYDNVNENYFYNNKVKLSIKDRLKIMCPSWVKRILKKYL